LVRGDVAEGTCKSTTALFGGRLLWRGVDSQMTLELLLACNRVRRRPPLPDDEVARALKRSAVAAARAAPARRGWNPRKDKSGVLCVAVASACRSERDRWHLPGRWMSFLLCGCTTVRIVSAPHQCRSQPFRAPRLFELS
jgi:hypothetical protein